MNILDIIILICLIPSLIQGLRKGFISQANAIISIIAGVWASAKFANVLGVQLAEYITASEQILKIVSFAIILALTFLVLGVLSRMLEGIVNFVMLGWVNKLLGAAFAFVKGVLILGLILNILTSLGGSLINSEVFSESALYPVINSIANTIFPYIKALFTLN
jgi:membrane protein required for colicin V production